MTKKSTLKLSAAAKANISKKLQIIVEELEVIIENKKTQEELERDYLLYASGDSFRSFFEFLTKSNDDALITFYESENNDLSHQITNNQLIWGGTIWMELNLNIDTERGQYYCKEKIDFPIDNLILCNIIKSKYNKYVLYVEKARPKFLCLFGQEEDTIKNITYIKKNKLTENELKIIKTRIDHGTNDFVEFQVTTVDLTKIFKNFQIYKKTLTVVVNIQENTIVFRCKNECCRKKNIIEFDDKHFRLVEPTTDVNIFKATINIKKICPYLLQKQSTSIVTCKIFDDNKIEFSYNSQTAIDIKFLVTKTTDTYADDSSDEEDDSDSESD